MKLTLLFAVLMTLLVPPMAFAGLRTYQEGATHYFSESALRKIELGIRKAGQEKWRTNPISAANAATWNLLGGASHWLFQGSSATSRVLRAAHGHGKAVYLLKGMKSHVAEVDLSDSGRTYVILLHRPLARAWYVTRVEKR